MRKLRFLSMIPILLLLLMSGFKEPASAQPGYSMQSRQRGAQTEGAAGAPADFFLETRFSKTEFYVGEAVTLTITWYQAKDVDNISLIVPRLEEKDFSIFTSRRRPSADCLPVSFGSRTVMAQRGKKTIEGKEYTTFSFQEVLVARHPGIIQFPGARISFGISSYKKPVAGLNPSDPAFLEGLFTPGVKVVKKLSVTSHCENLAIKPLPRGGKPWNFNGAVGRFRLTTGISAHRVAVGSPITLTMNVEGDCRPEDIPAPMLSKLPELTRFFGLPDEMAPGIPGRKSKKFTQTLWPKAAGKAVIPSIPYTYFDPDKHCYRFTGSEPIPIDVAPIGGSMKELWRQSALFGKDTLRYQIAPNYEGAQVMLTRETPESIIESPLWIFSVTLPPIGFLLLLFLRRRPPISAQDIAVRRSKRAYGVFRGRVRRQSFPSGGPDSHARLVRLMKSYLADKLNVETNNLTSADLEAMLYNRGVDGALIEQIRSVFTVCDRCKFSGEDKSIEDPDQLVNRILEIFRNLDRDLNDTETA